MCVRCCCENVSAWTNLFDCEGIVAMTGVLVTDYTANQDGVIVQDVEVVNEHIAPSGMIDHHRSYGFLRTLE